MKIKYIALVLLIFCMSVYAKGGVGFGGGGRSASFSVSRSSYTPVSPSKVTFTSTPKPAIPLSKPTVAPQPTYKPQPRYIPVYRPAPVRPIIISARSNYNPFLTGMIVGSMMNHNNAYAQSHRIVTNNYYSDECLDDNGNPCSETDYLNKNYLRINDVNSQY
jgi:hypothetical protein